MHGLTSRQRDILDYIKDFIKREGMSPSIYEIAEFFNMKATSASMHIKALQKKGFVERSSKARSIILNHEIPSKSTLFPTLLSIPILDCLTDQNPLNASDLFIGKIVVDPELITSSEYKRLFALKVKDNELAKIGIYENDLLIIRKNENLDKTSLGIFFVEGKTLIRYFTINQNTIELQIERFSKKSVSYPLDQVITHGQVIALRRSY